MKINVFFFLILVIMTLAGCAGGTDSGGPQPPTNGAPAAASDPAPDGVSPAEVSVQPLENAAQQRGTAEYFSYNGLEVEVSNVHETRKETIRYADESWEMEYSIFSCYPGAVVTVLNTDMSDPAYAGDKQPHPQWGFDTASGNPINIVDGMEPVEVTSDILGIYNKEASVYVLRFELSGTEPLKEEYRQGEFWRRVEYSAGLLSLADGDTPASYFERIDRQARAEAERYIREDCMPQEEEFQDTYGGIRQEDGTFYRDFQIESLEPGGVYVKDGTRYLVYTLRYNLKAVSGTRLFLAGGMSQSIDGWMNPGPDSVLALTLEDDGSIKLCFGQRNDIFPDNEEFFQEDFSRMLALNQLGYSV